jgi:hypothetical protein
MKLPLEKRTPGAIKSLQMSQAVQFMETNEPEVFKAFSKPALSRICGTLKCGDEDVLLLAKRWRFQHTRGCIIDYLSRAASGKRR